MQIKPIFQRKTTRIFAAVFFTLSSAVWAHGDVTPQAVNTSTLPALGSTWKIENPYRGHAEAIKIGSSAFNQNCARCHGLDAISGGIAPDLRRMDNECATLKDVKKQTACVREMDEFFVGKLRRGVTRNGAVYMPPFEGILNQEAAWSIKSYLETRREKPLALAK
jgi:cytochrome c-550 PedF